MVCTCSHIKHNQVAFREIGKWRKWQKKILEGICWCARADGGWLFTNNPSVIRECAGRWPFLAVRLSYACRLLTKQYKNSDFYSGTVSGWLDTDYSLIIWLILHETSIVWSFFSNPSSKWKWNMCFWDLFFCVTCLQGMFGFFIICTKTRTAQELQSSKHCVPHTALEKLAFPIERANGNICIFS